MISIRKFVVGVGMAAGIFGLTAFAMPVQAREVSNTPVTTNGTFTPSAACTAAINAIKSAAADDRSEDLAERKIARTVGTDAVDQTEDAAERADFIALFKAARTACLPAITGTPTTFEPKSFTPSASCTAAVQALKAAWMQHASFQQLQALGQAVRTACGWRFGR